ncbi:hypothetical protein ASPWEDRAFT_174111 [Aspergillus wentii DTO 134E9]|uniref:Zn(2)-C6 fungal-type domain-containing protein n=1 Tax=Aspergillus wentii DTO 134E9 TaxID=1073089 RepID=A0A1L9RCL0_ASPWE|nr:uncharacterized protein ASPWEDRAFT_174111 [Aspergillus wentii DTO 134E9]KAI9924244.1 hypothetical protein MW887_007194 [Aspergillus wentii]OJJ32660.1 hypothetical protein ASPWEDRAFT_174111 [Aspergillus wentii DTO 134E9]
MAPVKAVEKAPKWQTVFQVNETPSDPVYHPRRAHKKSRSGCLTCKKRRLKCDEAKPFCNRCQKIGLPCSYSAPSKSSSHGSEADKPDAVISSLSQSYMTMRIEDALQTDSSFREANSNISISVLALQNFINCSTETIVNPMIRQVMKNDVIHVAFSNSYLLHTIIGAGLLHINRKSPPTPTRRVAEAYFWQQAIQRYQKALQGKVSQDNVDALLSTCMLMSVNSLCPEKFSPSDSWVLSPKPGAMNWLCLQSGLRCILELADPYIPGSIWYNAFKESQKIEGAIHDDRVGRADLDPILADLCDIDDSTTSDSNPYHSPVQMVSIMMGLERNAINSGVFTTFVGRLEHDYLDLLRERDERALILLAYWMGLMCSVSQWQPWIEGRIRGECVAICMFLEGSLDPRILGLLHFPATACGYTLKELQWSFSC